MVEEMSAVPTSEERLMAGFSHLLGIVPALIFWVIKKDESEYVRHQSLQAIFYQIFIFLVSILLVFVVIAFMALFMLIIFGLMAAVVASENPESLAASFSIIGLLMSLAPGLFGVYVIVLVPLGIVNLIAAIFTFMGRPWRYPLIAKWVDRMAKGQPRPKTAIQTESA